jgi:hypothetical protein
MEASRPRCQDLPVSEDGELTAPIVSGASRIGTHGPVDHPPAVEIKDGDQIQPALASDSGDPGLIGTTDSETGSRFAAIGPPYRVSAVA